MLVVKVELHVPRVGGFLCDLEAEADARLGLEVVGAADVVEERLLTFEVAEGGLPAACGKYALVPEEFAHVLFNSDRYTVVGADHRNQVGGNREVVGVGAVGREEVSGRERILEHLVLNTKDALAPVKLEEVRSEARRRDRAERVILDLNSKARMCKFNKRARAERICSNYTSQPHNKQHKQDRGYDLYAC